jgi:hypothetical protein
LAHSWLLWLLLRRLQLLWRLGRVLLLHAGHKLHQCRHAWQLVSKAGLCCCCCRRLHVRVLLRQHHIISSLTSLRSCCCPRHPIHLHPIVTSGTVSTCCSSSRAYVHGRWVMYMLLLWLLLPNQDVVLHGGGAAAAGGAAGRVGRLAQQDL